MEFPLCFGCCHVRTGWSTIGREWSGARGQRKDGQEFESRDREMRKGGKEERGNEERRKVKGFKSYRVEE
jgi:hypothetical protein